MRSVLAAILVYAGLALIVYGAFEGRKRIAEQQRTIDALIELNHDKSVYIDSGCRVPYQGTEEMLPGEVKVLQ